MIFNRTQRSICSACDTKLKPERNTWKQRGERKERKREETNASRHHWKSHEPLNQTLPQGPSYCTLAAHAPSPSAFPMHPCSSQGPGPSAASKANWSIARNFPEASTWLPIRDNAIVSLSCFWAHFVPKDRATATSLIICLFLIHRWVKGVLCWRSRQRYGGTGQGGKGGWCSALVSALLIPV